MNGPAFIVPLQVVPSFGPQAVHLLAAAWAEAAGRRYGFSPTVLTPSGCFSPDELRGKASLPRLAARRRLRDAIPVVARTTAKDFRLPGQGIAFAAQALRAPRPGSFVWQHHQPFAVAGAVLAKKWGLPLVLHVDAPVAWESAQWAVRRPFGAAVERFGEAPIIKSADLVTCPSSEVADVVQRLFGIPPERLLVTPGGVDTAKFSPIGPRATLSGLQVEHVVGWVGSFRRFHGLENLVHAAANLKESGVDVGLLLVGDGQERARIEGLLHALGVPAAFTGAVPSDEVPTWLRAMDVACVTHPEVGGFHYSPMKLREYLATGIASVVPAVGELKRLFVDGEEVCAYDPETAGSLEQALRRVISDRALRTRIAHGGLTKVQSQGSWDAQLQRVIERLGST